MDMNKLETFFMVFFGILGGIFIVCMALFLIYTLFMQSVVLGVVVMIVLTVVSYVSWMMANINQ